MSITTATKSPKRRHEFPIDKELLKKAYNLMVTARAMAMQYDEERQTSSKYVHSTSRGHEAIQLATAFHLKPTDFASLYYRDESMLLGLGFTPQELMYQLMAKSSDPFSGGRTYYGHPSVRKAGFPTIPHQSSATGMQAIPATGMAHGIAYLEQKGLLQNFEEKPIVLCSLGDGSVTEGEVAEAFQMAVLKKLPIVYLIQDNEWGISATASEMRAMDAFEYAAGFKGLARMRVDGSGFVESYKAIGEAFDYCRSRKGPILVHARCPLIGHHTSGVRKEWYRGENDLKIHQADDPIPRLEAELLRLEVSREELDSMDIAAKKLVRDSFEAAQLANDPDPSTVRLHEFAPSSITKEEGERNPQGAEKCIMVDAALHAVDDLLSEYPEALFYGQDVGGELGGVFREAALLAKKYGDDRVFNTPIQEAYIIGSTAGMSAVGCKPIVEIQFADYIWPGINQLVTELSKSCYLSEGKFPIQAVIRVPIGAYGSGGPYHSGSIESTLANIRGIKVVYPSNAADMKGLMRAAFLDPNPVVMLEHKGIYWSKVSGTEDAKTPEPSKGYVIPLGKALIAQEASAQSVEEGLSVSIISYGMGVYWSKTASKKYPGQVEILDLRCINPIDWQAIEQQVKRHNKILIVTEEPLLNSFAESIAGRISEQYFRWLDAPVMCVGALPLPAVPLNSALEKAMLPSAEKVSEYIEKLISY
jgi:2-oxoisovalerate dehydrogenase E1 component